MQQFLLVLALSLCLLKPMAGVEQRPRLGSMKVVKERSYGALFALVPASWFMPLPLALLAERGRTDLGHNWFHVALLAACPLISYACCRMVAPERLRSKVGLLAARAALLPVLVVLAELLVLDAGEPLWTAGPLWAVSFGVTAAYLSGLRITDSGYFPLVLVWDVVKRVLVAAVVGYWVLDSGGTLLPDLHRAEFWDEIVAVMIWSVVAMAVGCTAVAGWKLVSWLRFGPPADPAPPGVSYWPPSPGEVWTAEITHADDTYKERPVVVLERTDRHVMVLTITSVDKSQRPRQYLTLRPHEWRKVLSKPGWLNVGTTNVPHSDFLWYRGECPDRVWDQLCDDDVVRERPASEGPGPGFERRHRFWAAMNAHAGPDSRTVPPGSGSGTRLGADLLARLRRVWDRQRA